MQAEYDVEKSRFIAELMPVQTQEEARRQYAAVKDRCRDATHHVPAFIIGENGEHTWASDDGEPQGTSGIPVLQVLRGAGLTNVLCVVTRYFGGIKLGTGGLARAYTAAARAALEKAAVVSFSVFISCRITFSYPAYHKIKPLLSSASVFAENLTFEENVSFDLIYPPEEKEKLFSALEDRSRGQYQKEKEKSIVAEYPYGGNGKV